MAGHPEPSLDEHMRRIAPCDLLLVEGFKRYPLPKLEVYRAVNGKALLHPDDPYIVAIATDTRLDTRLPQLDLNDHDAIADFILRSSF